MRADFGLLITPKRIPEKTKQRAVGLVLDRLDEYPNLTSACEKFASCVRQTRSCGTRRFSSPGNSTPEATFRPKSSRPCTTRALKSLTTRCCRLHRSGIKPGMILHS